MKFAEESGVLPAGFMGRGIPSPIPDSLFSQGKNREYYKSITLHKSLFHDSMINQYRIVDI